MISDDDVRKQHRAMSASGPRPQPQPNPDPDEEEDEEEEDYCDCEDGCEEHEQCPDCGLCKGCCCECEDEE